VRWLAPSLGVRYAFSGNSALALAEFIAVCGLGLSVAVLVIVISVVNGFERELRERIFGVLPHLSLYARVPMLDGDDVRRGLVEHDGVLGAVPFVQTAALVAAGDRVQGVLLTGMRPDEYASVSDWYRYLDPGRVSEAGATGGVLDDSSFDIVLGDDVARSLDVEAGDSVSVILPSGTVTPAGVFPRQKRFRLAAILNSASDLDGHAAYVHLRDAQKLLRLGDGIHGYQLRLEAFFAAPETGRVLSAQLGRQRFVARSWMHTHGNLYQAIAMQKVTMFVLLAFLVAVAAFNLVSTLVMVVDQRAADVAILRTMGSSRTTIVGAFVTLGMLIAVGGIGIGIVSGTLIANALPGLYSWTSTTLELELMSQYVVNYLPVEVRKADLTGIGVTALVIALLATLYPVLRAARLLPGEVLAYE